MPGFREEFRRGRDAARAVRGASPLARRQSEDVLPPPSSAFDAAAPDSWDDMQHGEEEPRFADAAETPTGATDRQVLLQQREAELAEALNLVTEWRGYAETLESRVIELITGAELMAKVLRLPGVRALLQQRFFPDRIPAAETEKRAIFTEASKIINAAYDCAKELHTSESSSEPSPPPS